MQAESQSLYRTRSAHHSISSETASDPAAAVLPVRKIDMMNREMAGKPVLVRVGSADRADAGASRRRRFWPSYRKPKARQQLFRRVRRILSFDSLTRQQAKAA